MKKIEAPRPTISFFFKEPRPVQPKQDESKPGMHPITREALEWTGAAIVAAIVVRIFLIFV